MAGMDCTVEGSKRWTAGPLPNYFPARASAASLAALPLRDNAAAIDEDDPSLDTFGTLAAPAAAAGLVYDFLAFLRCWEEDDGACDGVASGADGEPHCDASKGYGGELCLGCLRGM